MITENGRKCYLTWDQKESFTIEIRFHQNQIGMLTIADISHTNPRAIINLNFTVISINNVRAFSCHKTPFVLCTICFMRLWNCEMLSNFFYEDNVLLLYITCVNLDVAEKKKIEYIFFNHFYFS